MSWRRHGWLSIWFPLIKCFCLLKLVKPLFNNSHIASGNCRCTPVWELVVDRPAVLDTPRPPGLHPGLVLFGALAAVEFRGGAGPRPSGTSRTQQGRRGQEFFNHPRFSASPLSSVFCLSFYLVLCPSIPLCLLSFFPHSFYILQFKTQGSYVGTSAYSTCSAHTHTHTDMHAGTKARPLKALRQQKQQAVVCGLIALTGCRIIELDMSDRSVSGTKCTDEFVAALTMALIYRLFWTSPLCFTAQ